MGPLACWRGKSSMPPGESCMPPSPSSAAIPAETLMECIPKLPAPSSAPSSCVLTLKERPGIPADLLFFPVGKNHSLFLLPDVLHALLPDPGALVWSVAGRSWDPTFHREDFCSYSIPPASQLLHLGPGIGPVCISILLTRLYVASLFNPQIKYSCSGALRLFI